MCIKMVFGREVEVRPVYNILYELHNIYINIVIYIYYYYNQNFYLFLSSHNSMRTPLVDLG